MTRVLVVEDEASYSEALSYVLRKEGFDVAIAETGPDALVEFDRGGADIVLLDLMLPGLSGTEVCRQLRQISAVPIIMVSAKDTEVDKVVGLELGADDYVTKPYSPRELVARIRAVLRRGTVDDVDDGRHGRGDGRVGIQVEPGDEVHPAVAEADDDESDPPATVTGGGDGRHAAPRET